MSRRYVEHDSELEILLFKGGLDSIVEIAKPADIPDYYDYSYGYSVDPLYPSRTYEPKIYFYENLGLLVSSNYPSSNEDLFFTPDEARLEEVSTRYYEIQDHLEITLLGTTFSSYF